MNHAARAYTEIFGTEPHYTRIGGATQIAEGAGESVHLCDQVRDWLAMANTTQTGRMFASGSTAQSAADELIRLWRERHD